MGGVGYLRSAGAGSSATFPHLGSRVQASVGFASLQFLCNAQGVKIFRPFIFDLPPSVMSLIEFDVMAVNDPGVASLCMIFVTGWGFGIRDIERANSNVSCSCSFAFVHRGLQLHNVGSCLLWLYVGSPLAVLASEILKEQTQMSRAVVALLSCTVDCSCITLDPVCCGCMLARRWPCGLTVLSSHARLCFFHACSRTVGPCSDQVQTSWLDNTSMTSLIFEALQSLCHCRSMTLALKTAVHVQLRMHLRRGVVLPSIHCFCKVPRTVQSSKRRAA